MLFKGPSNEKAARLSALLTEIEAMPSNRLCRYSEPKRIKKMVDEQEEKVKLVSISMKSGKIKHIRKLPHPDPVLFVKDEEPLSNYEHDMMQFEDYIDFNIMN
jgi:hypothetical protein